MITRYENYAGRYDLINNGNLNMTFMKDVITVDLLITVLHK